MPEGVVPDLPGACARGIERGAGAVMAAHEAVTTEYFPFGVDLGD